MNTSFKKYLSCILKYTKVSNLYISLDAIVSVVFQALVIVVVGMKVIDKETANFLILDEPSSFMDFESSNELMSVLQSVRNDRIILLISHDPIYSESDFIKISI